MKELSIKEKAKAYDEAIERAKKLYGNGITEEIFPELKESQDEKIRKNCIHFLELQKQHHAATFEIEECIAWLEKQGKKPTDKTEPRFKVGDWVVNKFGDSWHIDSLDKKNYQVSDGKGNYNYFPISKQDEMHLLTIQDAKDGDVLVLETDEVEWVLIYKKIVTSSSEVPQDLLRYYFLLADNYCNLEGVFAMVTEDYEEYLRPATKEQRDALMKAMNDAGYEWDSEKKELKKKVK